MRREVNLKESRKTMDNYKGNLDGDVLRPKSLDDTKWKRMSWQQEDWDDGGGD